MKNRQFNATSSSAGCVAVAWGIAVSTCVASRGRREAVGKPSRDKEEPLFPGGFIAKDEDAWPAFKLLCFAALIQKYTRLLAGHTTAAATTAAG